MTEPVVLGLLLTVHGASDVLVSHRIANGNRRGSLRAGVLDSLRGRPVTLSSLLVAVWARARSGETCAAPRRSGLIPGSWKDSRACQKAPGSRSIDAIPAAITTPSTSSSDDELSEGTL
jgi:hypothetical protein